MTGPGAGAARQIFPHQKVKIKIKMPSKWRTIKSSVHKIRLHGRRGKGTAESFSREKERHAPYVEGRWMRNPVWPSSCVASAGTSNELGVQNKWKENNNNKTTFYIQGSSIAVATNTRSVILVTIVSCVRWLFCQGMFPIVFVFSFLSVRYEKSKVHIIT